MVVNWLRLCCWFAGSGKTWLEKGLCVYIYICTYIHVLVYIYKYTFQYNKENNLSDLQAWDASHISDLRPHVDQCRSQSTVQNRPRWEWGKRLVSRWTSQCWPGFWLDKVHFWKLDPNFCGSLLFLVNSCISLWWMANIPISLWCENTSDALLCFRRDWGRYFARAICVFDDDQTLRESNQWEFQDPKMKVLYRIICGDFPLHRPYIGFIDMVGISNLGCWNGIDQTYQWTFPYK